MLFVTFLYHNVLEFASYTTSEDFLSALTATVFSDHSAHETADQYSDPKGARFSFPVHRNTISIVFLVPDATEHPAVKYIYDLLRNIIVDSFAFAPVTKGDTIIDTILEVEFGCLRTPVELNSVFS